MARSCVWGNHRKNTIKAVLLTVSLCCLASCGQSSPGSTTVSSSDETLKPLAAPPGSDSRPPAPGTTGAPKSSDGLPALQPPLGLNNKSLFATPLADPEDRLQRLENAVQEIRNDFDAMSPSIVRLVAVEKDIQDLIEQLQSVVGDAPLPPPITAEELDAPLADEAAAVLPPPAPPLNTDDIENTIPTQGTQTPAPALPPQAGSEQLLNAPVGSDVPPSDTDASTADEAPTQIIPPDSIATPAPASATEKLPPVAPKLTPKSAPVLPAPAMTAPVAMDANVTGVRVGEHPDKTRIVLDIMGGPSKISHTVDLDNGEKILVVELPSTGWSAPATASYAKAPILASYKADKTGSGGTLLILQLKANANIVYQGMMPLPAGKQGGRIIIDLAKEK